MRNKKFLALIAGLTLVGTAPLASCVDGDSTTTSSVDDSSSTSSTTSSTTSSSSSSSSSEDSSSSSEDSTSSETPVNPGYAFAEDAAGRLQVFNETVDGEQAGVMGEIVSVETFANGGNQNIYVYDAGNFYRIKNLNASAYKAEVGKFVAFVGIKDGDDLTFKNVTVSEETVYEIAEQPKFEAKEYSTVASVGTNYVGTMTDAVITAVSESSWTVTYNGSSYTMKVRGDNLAAVQDKLASAEVGGKITAKVTKNYDSYYLLDAASITYTAPVKVAYTGTVQALASETGLTSSVEGNTLSITAGEIALVDGLYVISVDVTKPENLATLDNVKLTSPVAGLTLVKGTDKVTLNYTFTTTPTTGFTANINWNYDAKADQVVTVEVAGDVTYETGEVSTESTFSAILMEDWATNTYNSNATSSIDGAIDVIKSMSGFEDVFSGLTSVGSKIWTDADKTQIKFGTSSVFDAELVFAPKDGITITSVTIYAQAWNKSTANFYVNESVQELSNEANFKPLSYTDLSIQDELVIKVDEGRGIIAGFEFTYTIA